VRDGFEKVSLKHFQPARLTFHGFIVRFGVFYSVFQGHFTQKTLSVSADVRRTLGGQAA
jgi:hypothetical protein